MSYNCITLFDPHYIGKQMHNRCQTVFVINGNFFCWSFIGREKMEGILRAFCCDRLVPSWRFKLGFEEICVLWQITCVITDQRGGSTQSWCRALRFARPIEGVSLSFTGQVGWNYCCEWNSDCFFFPSSTWQIIVMVGEGKVTLVVNAGKNKMEREYLYTSNKHVKWNLNSIDKLKKIQ